MAFTAFGVNAGRSRETRTTTGLLASAANAVFGASARRALMMDRFRPARPPALAIAFGRFRAPAESVACTMTRDQPVVRRARPRASGSSFSMTFWSAHPRDASKPAIKNTSAVVKRRAWFHLRLQVGAGRAFGWRGSRLLSLLHLIQAPPDHRSDVGA